MLETILTDSRYLLNIRHFEDHCISGNTDNLLRLRQSRDRLRNGNIRLRLHIYKHNSNQKQIIRTLETLGFFERKFFYFYLVSGQIKQSQYLFKTLYLTNNFCYSFVSFVWPTNNFTHERMSVMSIQSNAMMHQLYKYRYNILSNSP